MEPPASTSDADVATVRFEAHAGALLALAEFLLLDRAAAELVVARVLTDTHPGPDTHHPNHQEERQALARSVYQRCSLTPSRDGDTEGAPHRAAATALERSQLSYQQRAAIGLSRFGAHSYRDAAALMHLPPGTVAQLQRSGLHRLQQARQ